MDTEDGREILFALHRVKSIAEAYQKTADVIRIAQDNNMIDGLYISLSQVDLTITLHGTSKEKITQDDWKVAGQIEASLVHTT